MEITRSGHHQGRFLLQKAPKQSFTGLEGETGEKKDKEYGVTFVQGKQWLRGIKRFQG